MNQRLVDIKDELEVRELQAKVASIDEAWGNDEVALELLCDAMDELEKQAAAGSFGPQGLSESQRLTLGVRYAQEALEVLEKEAEEMQEYAVAEDVVDSVEVDEDLQEKLAEDYNVGLVLGDILGNAGVSREDLDKLASEGTPEEVEQFGQLLAHLALDAYSEED